LVFVRKKLGYRTTGINLFLRKGLKYRACKQPKKNPQLLTEDSVSVDQRISLANQIYHDLLYFIEQMTILKEEIGLDNKKLENYKSKTPNV
jgi:hypothetical protein